MVEAKKVSDDDGAINIFRKVNGGSYIQSDSEVDIEADVVACLPSMGLLTFCSDDVDIRIFTASLTTTVSWKATKFNLVEV